MDVKDMCTLTEKKECQVIWHVAGSPERKYVGEFTFDPNVRSALSTKIAWNHNDIVSFHDVSSIDIILATDSDGKPWTFIDCSRKSIGTGGITFDVILAVQGAHFEKKSDIIFSWLAVGFPFLDNWLGSKPFRW